MLLRISLSAFRGAEIVRRGDMEGIFIPFSLNCTKNTYRNGKKEVVAFASLNPSMGKRPYDYVGAYIIPKDDLDLAITLPEGARKRTNSIWGYDRKKITETVSNDFDGIVNSETGSR